MNLQITGLKIDIGEGPGSRGGHITGYKNGKPIYGYVDHPKKHPRPKGKDDYVNIKHGDFNIRLYHGAGGKKMGIVERGYMKDPQDFNAPTSHFKKAVGHANIKAKNFEQAESERGRKSTRFEWE